MPFPKNREWLCIFNDSIICSEPGLCPFCQNPGRMVRLLRTYTYASYLFFDFDTLCKGEAARYFLSGNGTVSSHNIGVSAILFQILICKR